MQQMLITAFIKTLYPIFYKISLKRKQGKTLNESIFILGNGRHGWSSLGL